MLLVVGRIGRPHGIRGGVTVEVRTDDPDARFARGEQLRTDPPDRGPLTVAGVTRSGQVTVLHFDDVADRDAAEALRGTLLLVDTDDLPPTGGDDFYDHELIGLRAVHVDGTELGAVTDVLHAPASDVLTVTGDDGEPVLVPFVAAIVTEVDRAGGTLTIDPPDGMFAAGE